MDLAPEREAELRRLEARAARLGRYLKAFTAAKRVPSDRLWMAYFRAEFAAWGISRGWYSANRPQITAWLVYGSAA
jgi:hypothetical protein